MAATVGVASSSNAAGGLPSSTASTPTPTSPSSSSIIGLTMGEADYHVAVCSRPMTWRKGKSKPKKTPR
jgi:hypothetical protein